jgi:putative MATE family efflux protein
MQIRLSDHFNYRKMLRFTLPSITMMIVTSVYSVVDGFFVSNFAGKTSFAAVNLVMPVLMILGTVGFIFGTGGTALVAMTLGEGKSEEANRHFSLLVYTAFVIGVILAILGWIFIHPVMALMGATEQLLDNCVLYARCLAVSLPFYMLQIMFQSFFVAAEKPKLGLGVSISTGVTNMVLDAILVTTLPQAHKLMGAAFATAIAQIVGGVIPLVYFSRPNSSLLRLGKAKFNSSVIWKTCTNGASEFMNSISMSLVGMLYNLQLMKIAGENGIAAYGVMMYVSMIFAAIFIGYSIGMAPVVSYHYGAGDYTELKGLLRKSLILLIIFGIGMVLAAEIAAPFLSSFFVGYDPELYQMTVSGFRIFSLSFLFMGFGVYSSGFFTALNDGLSSAIISFLRSLVFQCTCVLVLPIFFGINGAWFSVVIAEALGMLVGFLFLITKRKKFHY